jgi:hypothetical protein
LNHTTKPAEIPQSTIFQTDSKLFGSGTLLGSGSLGD